MIRIRPFAFVLLLAAALVSLVPVAAEAQGVPVLTPMKLTLTVTAVGAGPTATEAVNNAISLLQKDYYVITSSINVLSTMCEETDPPGPIEPYTFCSAQVEARVIRKAILLFP